MSLAAAIRKALAVPVELPAAVYTDPSTPGPMTVGRLPINVEYLPGQVRNGHVQLWAYAEIQDTLGADGEPFDVFLAPFHMAPERVTHVTVIDQIDPETGEIDEHKAMCGFQSEAAAVDAYVQQYGGRERLGAVVTLPNEAFTRWARSSGVASAIPFREIFDDWCADQSMEKGKAHRYIKRVPIPGKTTKTGKQRYRYFYKVAHGGGVTNAEHFVEGASFRHGEGHYHVTSADGDKLTLKHDETGHELTTTKEGLGAVLQGEHGAELKAAHDRVKADWADALASGASAKQKAALKARAERMGVALHADSGGAMVDREDPDEVGRRRERVTRLAKKHPELVELNRAYNDLKVAQSQAAQRSQRTGIPPLTGAPPSTLDQRTADRELARSLNGKIREAAAKLDAALDAAESGTATPKASGEHAAPPKPRPEDPSKLTQIGDHIWGSRKDLAAARRITSLEELGQLTYSDAAAIVRKSKLVDPLTIAQAKAMGMSPGGAVAALAVLASIREKPDDTKHSRERYFDQVRQISGALGQAKTAEDVGKLLDEIRRSQRYAKPALIEMTSLPLKEANARATALTREMGRKVSVVYGGAFGYGKLAIVADEEPFDELGAKFQSLVKQKSGSDGARAMTEAYFLDMHRYPVQENSNGFTVRLPGATMYSKTRPLTAEEAWGKLESEEIAAEAKKAKPEKKERASSKAAEVAGEIRRKGGVTVPDASAARTKSKFGFREIDYGTDGYMNQADREYHTKALEEATHDLVDVLGIDPRQVSFNGRLGIAMGARGKGGRVAGGGSVAAHYEPGRHAINLTKYSGAGSYAHEWGHALDDIIARHYLPDIGKAKAMGFTGQPDSDKLPADLRGAVGGVMEAMTKHPDPERAKREHAEKLSKLRSAVQLAEIAHTRTVDRVNELDRTPPTQERLDQRVAALQERTDRYKAEIADLESKQKGDAKIGRGTMAYLKRSGEIASRHEWIKNNDARIAALKAKGIQTPEDIAEATRLRGEVEGLRSKYNDAVKAHNAYAKIDPTASDYLKNSVEMGGGYWSNPAEMFARAFESHVHGKLSSAGRENSYLVDPTPFELGPYPQGAEQKRISGAIDHLMGVLKSGRHLEKALASLPSLRARPRVAPSLTDVLRHILAVREAA